MEAQYAFKDTPKSQEDCIEKAIEHRKADNYRQEMWYEEGKGCSVGCMFEEDSEYAFDKAHEKTGIPLALFHLQEGIFEKLSIEDSKTWTENFYKAFPDPDTNISLVVPKLMYWLMGEIQECTWDKVLLKAIKTVERLYKRLISGENVSEATWVKAARAAHAAHAGYAGYAAKAYAAKAAARAAYTVDVAADDAAHAAGYAADDAAVYAKAYAGQDFAKKIADKLIELLEELK